MAPGESSYCQCSLYQSYLSETGMTGEHLYCPTCSKPRRSGERFKGQPAVVPEPRATVKLNRHQRRRKEALSR